MVPKLLETLNGPQALACIAELLPDTAVYVVDADHRVVYWSEGAHRLTGFSAEDALGEHCLKTSRCARCLEGCGVRERGKIVDAALTLFRKDGQEIAVRKHATAVYDPSGAYMGAIEVLTADNVSSVRWTAPAGAVSFHGIVSRDPHMLQAFATIRNVAETDATVLVRGESGTGKELVARAIHEESTRREGPFIAVNCGGLTPSLIESELFGHVKGAFTGAVADRRGVFAQAHGGTLFLDEIAELPLETQARLLRVLQERVVIPVGDSRPTHVDIRVVAATHQPLRELARLGKFREDLLYRLRVVPLFLSPLRERRTDIELLLWHFVETHNRVGPRRVRSIAPEALRALLDHDWPGNVRELYNVVEYAFAVGRSPELGLTDLPPELRHLGSPVAPAPATDLPRETVRPWPAPQTQDDEAQTLLAALEEAGGNVGRAAELLGISRPTFWRRRKAAGV